jgi:hypothetical protein
MAMALPRRGLLGTTDAVVSGARSHWRKNTQLREAPLRHRVNEVSGEDCMGAFALGSGEPTKDRPCAPT